MAICLPDVGFVVDVVAEAQQRDNQAGAPAMVENLKARPRICSRYSRLAISRMLRIGLASHGLDEDLFERRLNQLEAVDGGHGRGFVQQLLRVAVRLELDLGVAGEVLGLGDLARCSGNAALPSNSTITWLRS